MKKTRLKEVVVGVAAGMAITVMVGRIIPVNLHSGPAQFSTAVAQQDCCGPQAQTCPSFQCAAPY
jgi:hypothetical protein